MNELTPRPTLDLAETASAECSPLLWRLLTDDAPAELSVADIVADPVLHGEARTAVAFLRAHVAPCGKEHVARTLAPLATVFGVGQRGETQAFWRVYYDALADVPAESLAAAVAAYAKRPDAEFFPKPGPLRALALKHAAPLYKAAYRAKRAADARPVRPVDPQTAEERRELAERLVAGLRSAS
jgi:hypothetical protein